jgi:outer membrane protein assembly factor BamB
MNDLKKNSRTYIFVFGFIFLYLALFNFPVAAQQVVESSESVNLSLPFRLCYQKPDNKIASVNFASDNILSLFVAFQAGKIAKIYLTNNSTIWMSNLGGEIVSDLIFEDGRVYLITEVFEAASEKDKENDGDKQLINYILWSLNAETGLTEWQLSFTSNDSVFLDSYRDKIFLIAKDGTVSSIKKNDAQKISSKNLARGISSPPNFYENKIYLGTDDNSILTVSADNAEIISKIPTLQSPAAILIASGDKLFWGERKGFVNLFDTKSNSRVWSVRYGGEISSLTLVPDGILVSSLDNFVYLISPRKGAKIWKRRLAGRISAEPLIISNFAVFVTAVDNNAVVLDLRNGKIVNQISLADIGFILSKPVIADKSLVFSTNKGIFGFSSVNAGCSQR